MHPRVKTCQDPGRVQEPSEPCCALRFLRAALALACPITGNKWEEDGERMRQEKHGETWSRDGLVNTCDMSLSPSRSGRIGVSLSAGALQGLRMFWS